jgi:hypothetical protein
MKVIYETCSTRVPKSLVEMVKEKYEKRKKKEPKLRVIDVWKELEKKL